MTEDAKLPKEGDVAWKAMMYRPRPVTNASAQTEPAPPAEPPPTPPPAGDDGGEAKE